MKVYQPLALDGCLELLAALPSGATTILAGGTDLMPGYEQGQSLPDYLIDIKQLSELQGITATDEYVVIGGLTTIEELYQSHLIRQDYPALGQATQTFAGVQIRNRATLAGNIGNASPAGDMLPALYLYHAKVHLVSHHAARTIRLVDFISGPGKTILEPDELIHSIHLPQITGSSRYYKLGLRDAMAISVVNYALRYTQTEDQLTGLEITAGAVAPTIVFLDSLTEAVLAGESDPGVWDQLIQQDISPIDDIRASAAYRRKVLSRLIINHLQNLETGCHE